MQLDDLWEAIRTHRIKVTDHAVEEVGADALTIDEILRSVLHGEIIEDYPTDKPFPSCLVFGKLSSGAAAEMAGLPRVMFLDLCAEYDIPVSQITGDDLRRELAGA